MWRKCSTSATASATDNTFLRMPGSSLALLHLYRGREVPGMTRPVNAHFLVARLHTERVKQPVIVVRITIAFMHRDVELVGPFDKVQALDGERHFPFAAHFLR